MTDLPSGVADTAPTSQPPTELAFGLVACTDLPPVSAPADRYGEPPSGVDENARVEQIRAWAAGNPDYVDLWIDRADHNGWLTVAFTGDSSHWQSELDKLFPDGGVVAVTVNRSLTELEQLQARASNELPAADWGMSSSIDVAHGVVALGIGALTDERLAIVAERFANEPVCVEGADPSTIVPEGPQAPAGEGWQLLADQTETQPFALGLATTADQYAQLWSSVGISGPPPSVDFDQHVVVWFGAVYSGSCPDLRFDGIVADNEHRSLYPVLVKPGPQPNDCTADANGRAYVIAIERNHLPSAPFTIDLQPPDAHLGIVEPVEVTEDLRVPGTVHETGQ